MDTLNDKTLLLIEDNNDFIENAVMLFKMFVKNIFVANSIIRAKELLKGEQIDFIITDINLKNESGLDFVSELRNENKDIPIVILSGHKDEELLFRAMTLNLSGYLVKPINYKELMFALENCAAKLKQSNQDIVTLKDGYQYDKNLKNIIHNDTVLTLNKKEILFFEMLLENQNKVLTRSMFEAYVWEYEIMTDSALNNFIMRIRRRFGRQFLHTIPDVGYKMAL